MLLQGNTIRNLFLNKNLKSVYNEFRTINWRGSEINWVKVANYYAKIIALIKETSNFMNFAREQRENIAMKSTNRKLLFRIAFCSTPPHPLYLQRKAGWQLKSKIDLTANLWLMKTYSTTRKLRKKQYQGKGY